MQTHSAPRVDPRAAPARAPSSERPAPPSAPPARGGPADAARARFSGVAAALRLDAAVIDAALERLPVGVLVVGRDGRAAYANAAARELRLADDAALGWTVARALLTGDAVRGEEVEARAPGRAPRRLRVDVLPARGDGGAHAAVVTVADVTARAQAAAWAPVIESLMDL